MYVYVQATLGNPLLLHQQYMIVGLNSCLYLIEKQLKYILFLGFD